jgi:hypothetical protein
LQRQLSSTPCRLGQNWKYDERGIYVRQGCRAEFRYDGDPGGGGGGGNAGSFQLNCSSDKYRYTVCPADIRGGVRLVRQVSRSDCAHGWTWGTTRDAIWVSEGCRADFLVQGARSNRQVTSGQGSAPPGVARSKPR